jgi:hypothetical protein
LPLKGGQGNLVRSNREVGAVKALDVAAQGIPNLACGDWALRPKVPPPITLPCQIILGPASTDRYSFCVSLHIYLDYPENAGPWHAYLLPGAPRLGGFRPNMT